ARARGASLCSCRAARRDLHSVPTRRSSDLGLAPGSATCLLRQRDGGRRDTMRSRAGRREASTMRMDPRYWPKGYRFLSSGQYLRSEEHTSELQSREKLVCPLLHVKTKRARE